MIKAESFIRSLLLLVLAALFLFPPIVLADQIPDNVAVRVLISEAADQGFKGMVCVGEVLRRRGSPKGFYGYKHNRSAPPSEELEEMALRAWRESAHTNYTNGADHFENVRAFGKPSWVKDCIQTYSYKDHVFYKEVKGRKRRP